MTGPRAALHLNLPALSACEKAALAFFIVALVIFACGPLDYAAGLAVDTLRQVGASLSLFGVGVFSTTLAFFAPTGVLAVLAQKWRSALRQSARFEYALGFLRAATTAFLVEPILRLLPHIPLTALDVALGIAGLVALARFKVPVYWLYLAVVNAAHDA